MRVIQFPNGLQSVIACHALKKIGVDATSVQFRKHKFNFQPDICLNLEELNQGQVKQAIVDFLQKASDEYDIFHYRDLMSGILYTPSPDDIEILKKTGKPLVIQHHGSEVRIISKARSFNNPYVNVKKYWENEKNITDRLTQWGKIFDHAIVADHELYSYIEPYYKNIHIIRQPIDIKQYSPSYPSSSSTTPLIVHAPSHKMIKGSEYVINAVNRLESEGFQFKFQMIENMSYEAALKVYKKADVIIDQLCIGSFGMVSLEGMALGKPVVCYIRNDLLETYPENLPIINANPKTIYSELREIITNASLRRKLGQNGRKYVKENHDSIKIAHQLKSLYESL